MWPNPVGNGPLNIAVRDLSNTTESIEIEIYDLLGARIAQSMIAAIDGKAKGTIAIEGRPSAGLYMVHIRAGEDHFTRKLVLEH